ncbi:MAG: hypothetical protein ACREBB_06170 [Nitrosotalea sp.]
MSKPPVDYYDKLIEKYDFKDIVDHFEPLVSSMIINLAGVYDQSYGVDGSSREIFVMKCISHLITVHEHWGVFSSDHHDEQVKEVLLTIITSKVYTMGLEQLIKEDKAKNI